MHSDSNGEIERFEIDESRGRLSRARRCQAEPFKWLALTIKGWLDAVVSGHDESPKQPLLSKL